jgi:hypothetical protein
VLPWTCITYHIDKISVATPDPSDPYVLGPHDSWIRIPDPLVRGMDLDPDPVPVPDPSINKQK